VTGEGLTAGDVIWVPERISEAAYSADDTSTTSGFSFGGQGGMAMPGGDSGSFQRPGDMGSSGGYGGPTGGN
jgi:hypothetical protein